MTYKAYVLLGFRSNTDADWASCQLGPKWQIYGKGRVFWIFEKFNLPKLEIIASTGSPLVNESFEYVYKFIKKDVHLASISGGTDIVSCFVLGNPSLDVFSGEIQCAGLGMDVDIYDEAGNSLTNSKGELVCKSSFPSKPIYFWNDKYI